jgi:hypothetical protein
MLIVGGIPFVFQENKRGQKKRTWLMDACGDS